MRNFNFKISLATLAAAIAFAGTAHASINGESTDITNVVVGTSTINAGPHTSGKPGIAVPVTGLSNLVDFAGLQSVTTPDASNVYTISNPSGIDTDHSSLGVFHFAQVSGANVYFGEWSQTGTPTSSTHTAYYVGDDNGTTTVPTTGSATYNVKGISDYATNGLLSGTFNATFSGSSGTLTGDVHNTAGYTVDIGTAIISGATFSSDPLSPATASNSSGTLASNGQVSGRFFGSNAAALAGVVSFGNGAARQYNTAFGGSR